MFINNGGEMYGDRNCALCTIGAIFDIPSGTIARLLGTPSTQHEQSFAAAHLKEKGEDLKTVSLSPAQMQESSLAGMKALVAKMMAHLKKDCFISQGGSWNTLVPMRVQIGLMRIYPIGTKYAVYGSMEMKGHGAHWNYAERTEHGVEFRDYQYNDSEDNAPKVSNAFIPPRGGGASSGSYIQGIVLVFRTVRHLR